MLWIYVPPEAEPKNNMFLLEVALNIEVIYFILHFMLYILSYCKKKYIYNFDFFL